MIPDAVSFIKALAPAGHERGEEPYVRAHDIIRTGYVTQTGAAEVHVTLDGETVQQRVAFAESMSGNVTVGERVLCIKSGAVWCAVMVIYYGS